MLFLTKFCLLLALVLGCVSRTVSGLSLGTSSTLDNKTNLTCCKSSAPAALGATELYGSTSNKLLWIRDPNSTAPLPLCSSSSLSPPPSLCDVCRLEKDVYMICDNLPDGETLNLEAPPKPFFPQKSDCPRLPPAGTTSATLDAAVKQRAMTTVPSGTTVTTKPSEGLTGLQIIFVCLGVTIMAAIVIIIIIWFAYKRCKSQKTPGNEPNKVWYKPLIGSVLINMNGNGHAGPPVG